MSERVALVTGGCGSIGAASAQCLARDGWTMIQADLSASDAMVQGAHFQELDVRSRDSIARAAKAAASLGKFGALVLAHGLLLETDPGKFDEQRLETLLDVNLKGVARACSLCAPCLADGGAIVTLGSFTASLGRGVNAYVYQATKAAVESMTRTFAIQLASRNIRVNCVAPGFVSAPMGGEGKVLRELQGGSDKLSRMVPLGRLVTPTEVGDLVAFLCSDRASGITGTVIPIDGGLRAY